MRLLRQLLITLLRACFPSKASRPEDIPRKISPDTLKKAMDEARFLHSKHAVDVKDIATDELPGLPRRADKP